LIWLRRTDGVPVGERRLLKPAELWPQEQRLCDMAAEGELLDLRCRRPRAGSGAPSAGSERRCCFSC